MNKFILLSAVSILSAYADVLEIAAQTPLTSSGTPPAEEVLSTDLVGHYQVENSRGPLSASVSALYWKAYEQGLDYAIKATGASGLTSGGNVERAAFDWDWGVRVDLGYQIPQQKMDVNACWTYYKTDHTVSDEVTSPITLFSVWSVPAGNGTAYEFQSSASSNLDLNVLDVGISTSFAPRCFLDITPFVDLSTVWIHQKFEFHLSRGPGISGLTVVDDHIDMRNNYWGIGPKFGINTRWNIGWGLGICGNFNLSLLYGFFDVTQHEATTFNGTAPIPYLDVANNEFHISRLNSDLFLGLRWDKIFSCNRYHLLLEAGWENLIFLGQNQLMRFTTQTNSGINIAGQGDLSLQGLSLRALFAF